MAEEKIAQVIIGRDDSDYISHYGTPRHSGRYPYGSGENPYQHNSYFMKEKERLTEEFKAMGYTGSQLNTQVAKAMNMTSTEYRERVNQAKDYSLRRDMQVIAQMTSDGYSNVQIANVINSSEGKVRDLKKKMEDEGAYKKLTAVQQLSDDLKAEVDQYGLVDISAGVESNLGVSKNRLNNAAAALEGNGYKRVNLYIPQATNYDQKTTIKVLVPEDMTTKEAYDKVFEDGLHEMNLLYSSEGPKATRTQYPTSVSSDRVMIRYSEDGGTLKDGVIELRRGPEDLSLGKSNYAQVRIAVDDTHYMKGMAIYAPKSESDKWPEGIDIVYNTNKNKGKPMIDNESPDRDKCVLKPMKIDKTTGEIDQKMPFGALIKEEKILSDGTIKPGGQTYYEDKKGLYILKDGAYVKDDGSGSGQTHYNLSPINKLKEEGDWDTYSKSLSSQFLSKQSTTLIKKQLDLSYSNKLEEFESIKVLTNPNVKKNLLKSFAESCDQSAVDLKAASLPGQQSRVLLPVTDMKDTEVYAPQFKDGSTVVLVRYPHGGIFEIPELRVNNKQKTASETIGPLATDAIGISLKTAEKLSGADFDGDSVIIIPVNNKVRVSTMQSLKDLKDFDPKSYQLPDSAPKTDIRHGFDKQMEMGKVSNLITDMHIQGAGFDDIAKAVRHSMVVIDAEKHHLDWKRSEIDNDIPALKEKYQGAANAGASTIISKASSLSIVDQRKPFTYAKANDYTGGIDPETGEKIWAYTNAVRPETKGKGQDKLYRKVIDGKKQWVSRDTPGEQLYIKKTQNSTKMAETKDASSLVSKFNSEQELLYAKYANQMKSMANEARLLYLNTSNIKQNKEAKQVYAKEVESLKNKLQESEKNRPRERVAQVAARAIINQKLADNPDLRYDPDTLKKISQNAITDSRLKYNAHRYEIIFSDKEWEAVQSGAISSTTLDRILERANEKQVKQLSTPKETGTLSSAQLAVMNSMKNSGYTISDIADRLGVSASTISKKLKE